MSSAAFYFHCGTATASGVAPGTMLALLVLTVLPRLVHPLQRAPPEEGKAA